MSRIDAPIGTVTSKLVEKALELDELSTDYRVELRPAAALEFVGNAGAYNGFTRQDLVTLVKEINDLVPTMKFGEGNPNNGKPHHVFKVGNEGSRVIYLEIYKTYLKGRWTAAGYKELTRCLELVARKANADEFAVEEREWDFGGGKYVARFWWD